MTYRSGSNDLAAHHREVILNKVQKLRDVRGELAMVRAEWSLRQDEFKETNKDLFDRLTSLAMQAEEVEREIRRDAVDAYRASGYVNKHPAPGVAIRVMHRLVYEPAKALEWAVRHRIGLILDVKTFEAIAEAAITKTTDDTADLRSIVRREDAPKATVTPKLDEVLRELGHAAGGR